ncbi:hypothetical protein KC339_g78 [Hortaea werneckii]|nr:hypothetical protein KC339_g78 [Hortaea werneckii]
MKTLHVTSLAARRSRVRSQASLATSANDLPRKQKASADPFLPVLSRALRKVQRSLAVQMIHPCHSAQMEDIDRRPP